MLLGIFVKVKVMFIAVVAILHSKNWNHHTQRECITALKSKSRQAGTLLGGESSSSTAPSTGKPGIKQIRIVKLTPLDVGMFAVKHNIKKESELFAASNVRYLEGNNDLADYVMWNSRRLTDIIDSA